MKKGKKGGRSEEEKKRRKEGDHRNIDMFIYLRQVLHNKREGIVDGIGEVWEVERMVCRLRDHVRVLIFLQGAKKKSKETKKSLNKTEEKKKFNARRDFVAVE